MLDRLVRLRAAVRSTQAEAEVADLIEAELRELGAEPGTNGAVESVPDGADGWVARVPGRREGWVMLCARRPDAIAALLELVARAASRPPAIGIELLFPAAEWGTGAAAAAVDVEGLRAPFGFVLDHASPVGEVITAGPAVTRVVAHFEGIAADAGSRSEGGHSAIAAACTAVASLRLSRRDAETTANVGVIEGGTAVDAVPQHCRVEAEARSLDPDRTSATAQEIVDACTWAASEHGCDVDVEVVEALHGYRVGSRAAPLRIAAAALRRCGHEPHEVASLGDGDADVLIERGYECVLLGCGVGGSQVREDPAAAARVGQLVQLVEAIVAVAGEELEPSC